MLWGIPCIGDEVEVVHFLATDKCARLLNALQASLQVREVWPLQGFLQPALKEKASKQRSSGDNGHGRIQIW